MALTLSLAKDGQSPNKFSLNLAKPAVFSVELDWDSEHDLDGHALLAKNQGGGAKIEALEQILSTYNCKKTNASGALTGNPDGSFATPDGALRHSGDARTGVGRKVDEIITIDGAKVPAGVNEIPIFITIHPSKSAKFDQVKAAGLCIKHDGKLIQEYRLSDQFKGFDAVQMGSLILENGEWKFAEVAVGFNGDFNSILGHFS